GTVAPFVLQYAVERAEVGRDHLGEHASGGDLPYLGNLRQVAVVCQVSLGSRQVGVGAAVYVQVEDEPVAGIYRTTAARVYRKAAEGVQAAVEGHVSVDAGGCAGRGICAR